MKNIIQWNDQVKLIFSDVDETIADLYKAATDDMIFELGRLLSKGIALVLISGQSFDNINKRIIEKIQPVYRNKILVSACSGAELWGFDKNGNSLAAPFYNLYDNTLTDEQKNDFRGIIRQIISEFKLLVFPTMPIEDFKRISNGNPLSIMLEDRNSQIALEIVNAYNLSSKQLTELKQQLPNIEDESDLRISIMQRSKELLLQKNIPISCRLAGVFAVDYAVDGTSKSTAVNFILNSKNVLQRIGIDENKIIPSKHIEVWGDRFSIMKGTDYHMSICLPKEVRSISFRQEDMKEFPEDYNIIIWNGKQHLQEGLLEYLRMH